MVVVEFNAYPTKVGLGYGECGELMRIPVC